MSDTMARRYVLTINNPVQSDEEFSKYVESLEHFKYCCFQREKGEQTGTEHFQVFVIFTCGKRFSTIKNYFPTAHIEKANGTNTSCRDYCSKTDTRLTGPYEIGQFAEERARTDISNYIELVQNGCSDTELIKLYPKLYLSNVTKNQKLRQNYLFEEFSRKYRDVEVTYIYGSPGSGKTSYLYNKYGFGKFYYAGIYDKTTFDFYKGEDILVLDEFNSQFKIEFLNGLLDRYPFILPARFENKVACYTKVYIISNLPISEQYKNIQEERNIQYKAFLRRIKTIIRIEKTGKFIERDNYKDLDNKKLITLDEHELQIHQATIDDMF